MKQGLVRAEKFSGDGSKVNLGEGRLWKTRRLAEYLNGGKKTCDSLVWQLYNKNDKVGGIRLTNRSGDVGDPSLVSRRNVLVEVREEKM